MERPLRRDDLLKLAATGAVGLIASRSGLAEGARAQLAKESGRLQVLDWVGYEVKDLYAPYLKKYPGQKPKFTFMTNEANALAKLSAGLKPDVVRPYVGYVPDFADSGFFQPWDPKLIPNLKQLNPSMVKAGQYKGKQWGVPQDWGFDAILYRTDKVTPKARSWSLLFDDRYKGKISWFDDLNMLTVAGLYLGFKDPWNQSDAQLKQSQKLLISKKKNVRLIWSSETNLWEAFGGGDVWIAYAWPNDWVQMKKKKLKVVYMRPKEKPIARVGMFMLLKGTKRPHLAHAYVNAWS